MTALLQDGVINPYKRHWWGGVPPGWTEEARTVRSALCMTKEGFVGYFYGSSVDPDVLALAMQRARCNYGIHLDMNPGTRGSSSTARPPAGTLPKLNRPARRSLGGARSSARHGGLGVHGPTHDSAHGTDELPPLREHRGAGLFLSDAAPFAARRADHAPFVKPAEAAEGVWSVQGLPQHGWPYAIAKATLRPDPSRLDTRVGLVRLDPKFLRVAHAGERDRDAGTQRVLDIAQPLGDGIGKLALYHDGARFLIAETAPPGALLVTRGFAQSESLSHSATSAMGVDAQGMLVFARFTSGARPGGEGALLGDLLKRLGCASSLYFLRPLGVRPGRRTRGRA